MGQRAYLAPEQFILAEPLTANHPVKITYWFKNTGQTPAIDVKTGGITMILEQDFAPNISASQDSVRLASVTFQGSGQSRGPEEEWLEDNPNRLLREDELQDIMAKKSISSRFWLLTMATFLVRKPQLNRACNISRGLKKWEHVRLKTA
ncbi:MAG TPA: hypothetical protein VKT33_07640 [Candidatus Angelobacter sp.]|nr:hypothetical protein [Candidatus Angelobacter sp.]